MTQMIQGFYVISENGACIYEYRSPTEYTGAKYIDSSLISGFISALFSFSSEAFAETLQTINLKRNILVISTLNSISGPLVSAAIADMQDNPKLVQKISQELLQIFEKEIGYTFGPMSFDEKLILDHAVRQHIEERVRKRSKKTLLLGSLAAIPVYALASYLYYNPISGFLSLLAFPIGLFLSSICSYYIGSTKTSAFTMTMLVLLLNQPMRYVINLLSTVGLTNFVEFPEIFLVISVALGFIGGIVGGWYADRLYIYQTGYEDPIGKMYKKVLRRLKRK
ncbi:MAG: hypothetical protein ACTSYO_03155 [Candidatus Ranarchaeia archaeon]